MFQWIIVGALILACATVAIRSVGRFLVALNHVPSDPSAEHVGCHGCPAQASGAEIKVLPLVTLRSKPPA
jgi:hypothetical protein